MPDSVVSFSWLRAQAGRRATVTFRRGCRAGEDHPRMRGEHWERSFRDYDWWGSTIHARGARPGRRLQHRGGGISRTRGEHKGPEFEMIEREGSVSDQPPHARGALYLRACVRQRGGISPHVRGTPGIGARPAGDPGISPARAGSTSPFRTDARRSRISPARVGSTSPQT